MRGFGRRQTGRRGIGLIGFVYLAIGW